MQWKTIAPECCFGRKHTGVGLPTQLTHQLLWYAGHVALYSLARSHTLGRDNVRVTGLTIDDIAQKSYMSVASGVMLDAFNHVLSRRHSAEIQSPYPSLRTATTMSHSDVSRMVSASDMLALPREGERKVGTSFVQVVVDRTLQVSDARCSRLVGAQDDGILFFWMVSRLRLDT